MDIEKEIEIIKERQEKVEGILLRLVEHVEKVTGAQDVPTFDYETSAEPILSEDLVELVDLEMKVIGPDDDDDTDFLYKIHIRNKSDSAVEGWATIKYLDEDGFEVDQSIESFTLSPHQETTLTGKNTVYDLDEAERIKTTQAIIECN